MTFRSPRTTAVNQSWVQSSCFAHVGTFKHRLKATSLQIGDSSHSVECLYTKLLLRKHLRFTRSGRLQAATSWRRRGEPWSAVQIRDQIQMICLLLDFYATQKLGISNGAKKCGEMRDLCSLVYKQTERNVIYFTLVTDCGKTERGKRRGLAEHEVGRRRGASRERADVDSRH